MQRIALRLRMGSLLGLVLLFTGGLSQGQIWGQPAFPLPPASKAIAVITARQMAQFALVATIEQELTVGEAQAMVKRAALNAAQSRATETERDLARSPSPASGVARVPILMYHHIATPPPNADAIRRDLSVRPIAFQEQIGYLRVNGYQAIGLDDLVDYLLGQRTLPIRAVVLTFDDGYEDNYTQAFPALRSNGFTGTFFIITDYVGQREYMTWEQIAEMSRAGMSMQAHGRTHDDLAISSAEHTAWQVAGSRMMLEEKLGQPVHFFCYPSGRYTAQTITILRAHGYTAALTTAYGATHSASSLFELRRVRVRGSDTLGDFVKKLETAP